MGAGKTTVGRLLAERWGVPFGDTDDVVERAEGRTVSDIFVDSGEEHFRALERAAVAPGARRAPGRARARRRSRDVGGDPRDAGRARRSSSSGSGSPTPRRGSGSAPRGPLLLGNVRGTMKALLDERTPVYERLDRLGRHRRADPDEVADRVEEVLRG